MPPTTQNLRIPAQRPRGGYDKVQSIRGIQIIIAYNFKDGDILWEALQGPAAGYGIIGMR